MSYTNPTSGGLGNAPGWNWAVSPLATLITGGFGGSSAKTDRGYELHSMGNLQNMSDVLSKLGMSNLTSGSKDMSAIMNQLLKITGGGQGAMEAVAPQVNTIASQYQAGRRAAAELSPRGGGRTAALSDTGFKEMGDVQKMLFGAQSQARSQAGSMAGEIANLGLSATGTAVTAAGNAADIAQNHATSSAQSSAAMGQGIGQLLAMMMMAG